MGRIAQRIYERYFAPKAEPKKAKRRYAAARRTRANADWTTTPAAVNRTLRSDLRTLRARSREMAKNAPHFRKFLQMATTNVIGAEGIRLQVQARVGRTGGMNTRVNRTIEDAFREWGYRETCTASRKLDWAACQRLFVTQLIRDGEVLLEHITPPVESNKFGYQIKFWSVDWLDETYTTSLPNGNRVIMSIEVDENDRPVAYWLTQPASELDMRIRKENRTRQRMPAESMTHAFIVTEDESQARGVPQFAAVLLSGKNFHEYTGHVIEQARVGAASLGFLEKAVADEVEFDGSETDEGREITPTIDVAPLSMNELPAGYSLKQFDPKQPTQQHSEFSKTILLELAAGLGVCGFSLSGDMSAVNYSSARVGLGEERDVWRAMQAFVANTLCREVYKRFLANAMTSGVIQLSLRDFEQAQNPLWRPRGWRYVDPQKEIGASIEGIKSNLLTFTGVLAEQGIDFETHLDVIVAERELAARKGVKLEIIADAGPTSPAAKPKEKEDPEETEDPEDDEAASAASA